MNTLTTRTHLMLVGLAGVLLGLGITLVSNTVRNTILTVVAVLAGQLYLRLTRDSVFDQGTIDNQYDARPMRIVGLWTAAATVLSVLAFVSGPGALVLAMVVVVGTWHHVNVNELWLDRQWGYHRRIVGQPSDGAALRVENVR